MISVFLFYHKSAGKQARLAFSKKFKHVEIIAFDGATWINLQDGKEGVVYRIMQVTSLNDLLRHLRAIPELEATITISLNERRAKTPWRPFSVRSCNEFARHVSGADIGFTFNPVHLYYKLKRHSTKRNYDLLHEWSREHGVILR